MNKREKMYQQIQQHGENLNAIFNTGLDPVKLCKKLHSLEMKAHKIAVDYCNGENGVTSENIDRHTAPILDKVNKILFHPSLQHSAALQNIVIFNGDARGYALKLSDKIVAALNLNIHKDWGGYGILAPEFTGE